MLIPPAQIPPDEGELSPPATAPERNGFDSGARSRYGAGGGTRMSERAAAAALNWLARHQMLDGRWSLDKFTERCKDAKCTGAGKAAAADSAATALALLPFLGAGQTHISKGPYQKTIHAGLYWLLKNENARTGDVRCGQSMYAQGLASVCLCEAFRLTPDPILGHAAQKAVDFIVEAQNKDDGGWRYNPGDPGDLSVTGWQLMALKSGQMAGLEVPQAAFDKAQAFVNACATGKNKGLFRYMPAYGHPGSNTMTAVGLLCRQYMHVKRDDPALVEGQRFLINNLPENTEGRRNIDYWYFGTLAMHYFLGPDWDTWNRKLRHVLIDSQIKEGCAEGSWDPELPVRDAWGEQGGRIFVTSLSTLSLEVYYRYLSLFKLDDDRPLAERGQPAPAAQQGGRRPNILWIMADQFRADCVGANGNKLIKTPNLDRLAQQSANFTQAFVQAPVCVPSRASYFTGRYPHSHRNRVNYTPLAQSEVLLPARLQGAGYRTCLVGKTHLYYHYPPTPEEARQTGFELVDLHDGMYFTDEWSEYAQWRQAHDPLHDIPYRRLARQVPQLRGGLPPDANPNRAAIDQQYTDTAWTGQRTRERLKELAAGDRPFFLFSSFFKPHGPYEVPAPYDAMYNTVDIPLPEPETLETLGRLPPPVQKLILRGKKPEYDMDRRQLAWLYRSYYGSISHLDREIGLLLDALKEAGALDNTIVIFSSDHGDQLLEHGLTGKNVFFEASIRVPLMIGYPRRIRPGRRDELVESIDVLPTLLELAGLPEPDNCQGRSLLPLCDGSGRPAAPRDAVFSENVIPEVITDGGSLDFSFTKGQGIKGVRHPDAKMVRTRRWKYTYYPDGYDELYDLAADPHERHNLAAEAARKPVVDEMRQRLLNWLITADESDQIAPRWLIPKAQTGNSPGS